MFVFECECISTYMMKLALSYTYIAKITLMMMIE